jgi:hypothetical protein
MSMGRESDHKLKRVREFPSKLKWAIERWDVEYLASLRWKFTSKISAILSSKTLEAYNSVTGKLNNFVQVIDEALDKACETKSKKV